MSQLTGEHIHACESSRNCRIMLIHFLCFISWGLGSHKERSPQQHVRITLKLVLLDRQNIRKADERKGVDDL